MLQAKERETEKVENELIKDMASFSDDPYRWVLYSFEWGEGELTEFDGPEPWQAEALMYVRDQLQAGEKTAQEVIQLAVASGNGSGKSVVATWLILWGLSTFEDTRGVITANTEAQLRTKTWAELSKWYRLFIAKHWFKLTATAIYSIDPEHERTWRIDQIPWSEQNSEAFAGLHNKGKRILLIFDEASAIPDAIWEVSEGALTDENTEIIWAVFGNPTRNVGRFRECWGKLRHRWKTWQIDIRKSKLVNQKQVEQWIEDLGLDSDWIRVHVLGQFPKTSELQFISTPLVDMARGRQIEEHKYNFAAKIIGVDPAWEGGDKTVIGLRQGLVFRILQTFLKNDDDTLVAGAVAKWEDTERADAVFIDLAYGTGVYSFGKQSNRQWMLVSFGSKANTAGFANKRAEMWGKIKDWLGEGGCIPDNQELADDLTGPEAYPRLSGDIVLESKKDMKKRGLASPDKADALALTFAYPVMKKIVSEFEVKQEYDPFS